MEIDISIYSKKCFTETLDATYIYFGNDLPLSPESRKKCSSSNTIPSIVIYQDAKKFPIRILLRRPLISSEDIFYVVLSEKVVVTNYYKHALNSLRSHERTIDEAAKLDHFLFRVVPGENTYCENIKRVGHGSEIEIDLMGSASFIRKRQISLFNASEMTGSQLDYIDRADDVLRTYSGRSDFDENLCLLYSGGIDSTLLATYFPQLPLLNSQITSREFRPEVTYSEEGASLLGRSLNTAVLDENGFMTALEHAIDSIGMPPHHAQSILLYNSLGSSSYSTYMIGQLADALYGLLMPELIKYRPLLKHKPVRTIVDLSTPIIRRRHRRTLKKLISQNHALNFPVDSEYGYALTFAQPAKTTLVENVFGKNAVRERIRARYQYVMGLGIPEPKGDRFADHVELAHLIDYFADDTLTVWQQMAKSLGKELYFPFANKDLVTAAYSVPSRERYHSGGEVKYILKELLYRRLPPYPRDRKKLGGVLPVKRFFLNNMFWDRLIEYRFPEFITKAYFQAAGTECPQFLWHAATYMIWEERIVRAKQLTNLNVKPTLRWRSRSAEPALSSEVQLFG